jgi:hypothetical protein
LRAQKKGKIRPWKPIPSNGSKDVTVDTIVYAQEGNVKFSPGLYVKEPSPINPVSNPNSFCNHA